jgi:predicted nucleotidyltransferase
MYRTSLIQQVRAKKKDSIIAYLKEAFKGFDCPVYLFGSYATETFHGESDVDILVISPQASLIKNYCEACNKMSGLGLDYDILMANSFTNLDRSIVNSLQKINFFHEP